MKHYVFAEQILPFWTMFESLQKQLENVGEVIVRVKFRLEEPAAGVGRFRATIWTEKGGDRSTNEGGQP